MDESSAAGEAAGVGGRAELVCFFCGWAELRPPARPRWTEHRPVMRPGMRGPYRVTSWVHLLCTGCSVLS